MAFCLRNVDANLEVHEEFIVLYNLEHTNAGMIVSVVEDVLLARDRGGLDAWAYTHI